MQAPVAQVGLMLRGPRRHLPIPTRVAATRQVSATKAARLTRPTTETCTGTAAAAGRSNPEVDGRAPMLAPARLLIVSNLSRMRAAVARTAGAVVVGVVVAAGSVVIQATPAGTAAGVAVVVTGVMEAAASRTISAGAASAASGVETVAADSG